MRLAQQRSDEDHIRQLDSLKSEHRRQLESETQARKDMELKYNNDLDLKQRHWDEEDKRTIDRLNALIVELRSTIVVKDTLICSLKVEHSKSLNDAITKFQEWQ